MRQRKYWRDGERQVLFCQMMMDSWMDNNNSISVEREQLEQFLKFVESQEGEKPNEKEHDESWITMELVEWITFLLEGVILPLFGLAGVLGIIYSIHK